MISEINEKKEWNEILSQLDYYDCYHTYEYHDISKNENEQSTLLVYKSDDFLIAIPLIIRPIEDTDYFDATSVYGYSGPVLKLFGNGEDYTGFQSELNQYFKKKNIISVFSRLNPFIDNQDSILNSLGNIEELGKVVNIDLTEDLELQRQVFSKTTKRYLNKANKLCNVKRSKEEKDITTFVDLYYENMDRVNAKDSYYFEKDYFFKMINASDFETEVVFAVLKDTDEIISAAMMMKTKDIIQYHISGTKNDYLKITPIRLLLDETRIEGTKEGFKYFNLGGGLGSEEDSLFNFKASFSKDFKQFKVWKYVANQEVYDELSKDSNKDTNFFPLYRSKN